jgi:hypothetical protein
MINCGLLQLIPIIGGALGEVIEAKFVDKTQSHAGVLEHMIEGQVLNLVLSAMDVGIRVLKCRLDDKGRGVASLGGGGMVRASISALSLNPRNVAILMKS